MELGRLAVSENLRAAIQSDPLAEIEAVVDFEFDGAQNLISPFAPAVETAGARCATTAFAIACRCCTPSAYFPRATGAA